MRRLLLIAMLAMSSPALAGPSVSKSIVKDIPAEALAAATALEE